jgi:hypothetical protein
MRDESGIDEIGRRSFLLRALIRWVPIIATAALFSFLVAGCGKRQLPDQGMTHYRTSFDSPAELKDWKCLDDGKWEIRDGWLVAEARSSPTISVLWLDRPLPRDFQVDFEAECLDNGGNINCFLYGNGKDFSGYEVQIGSSSNKKIALTKIAREGDDKGHKRLGRTPFSVVKNRPYTVKIKVYRGTFRVYVNDELLITQSDPKMTYEGELRYFGFSSRGNVVRFDNLKIEKKA